MLLLRHFLAALVLCTISDSLLLADISLPKIFTDHMVLQRNSDIKIKGKALPDQKLVVKFNNQTITTNADSKGKWSVTISTGKAGGPFELGVTAEDSDLGVRFSNIMVGDVWICAGGVDMATPVSQMESAEDDMESSKNFSSIRLFRIDDDSANSPLPEFTKVAPWYCCSPETIKNFSAIGYYFGREVSKDLKIPVGLISATQDSATLESWMPYKAVAEDTRFKRLVDFWKEKSEPDNPLRISNTFNGMIAPLEGLPIAGVVWFHGESNLGRGQQYQALLPVMINSWRKQSNLEQLPFIIVQPYPDRYQDFSPFALPEIWDAQLKTHLNDASTGLVTLLDMNKKDALTDNNYVIADRISRWAIYFDQVATKQQRRPQNDEAVPDDAKIEAGQIELENKGAAQAAKASDVSTAVKSTSHQSAREPLKPSPCSGPIFEEMSVKNSTIILTFRDPICELKLEGPVGFEICGEDRNFVAAVARIVDGELNISNPQIESPVAVRYGWKDSAQAVLFDNKGMPAPPFRTDDFPLVSDGVEY